MRVMPAVATGPMIRREIGDDHVCLLVFDRPESGANIFDAATLDELNEHLDSIENDNSLRGLIIASAKKSIFVAGADLKTLLQQAQSGDMRAFIAHGQRVLNRLAELKIPTVAAIHGASAGGGYEVTLACDYRIASDDPATRIGLPETTLGLIPAWGGCTRLPRLIGVEKAAEVIAKGKLYSAEEARKLGLVDGVASRDKLLELARKKLRDGKRKLEGETRARPASQELRASKTTRKRCTRTCLGNHQQDFVDFARPIAADGAGCDCGSWQIGIDPKLDSQFLPGRKVQERNFESCVGEGSARRSDRRGRHGLRNCAMA